MSKLELGGIEISNIDLGTGGSYLSFYHNEFFLGRMCFLEKPKQIKIKGKNYPLFLKGGVWNYYTQNNGKLVEHIYSTQYAKSPLIIPYLEPKALYEDKIYCIDNALYSARKLNKEVTPHDVNYNAVVFYRHKANEYTGDVLNASERLNIDVALLYNIEPKSHYGKLEYRTYLKLFKLGFRKEHLAMFGGNISLESYGSGNNIKLFTGAGFVQDNEMQKDIRRIMMRLAKNNQIVSIERRGKDIMCSFDNFQAEYSPNQPEVSNPYIIKYI